MLYSCSEDRGVVRWKNNGERFEKVGVYGGVHEFPIYTCHLLNSGMLVTVSDG